MEVNGISDNAAGQTQAAVMQIKSVTDPTQGDTKAATNEPHHDTVKLSGMALAQSLKQAGETPAEIAVMMDVDIKTVDSYLGISTAALSQPGSAHHVNHAAPDQAAAGKNKEAPEGNSTVEINA